MRKTGDCLHHCIKLLLHYKNCPQWSTVSNCCCMQQLSTMTSLYFVLGYVGLGTFQQGSAKRLSASFMMLAFVHCSHCLEVVEDKHIFKCILCNIVQAKLGNHLAFQTAPSPPPKMSETCRSWTHNHSSEQQFIGSCSCTTWAEVGKIAVPWIFFPPLFFPFSSCYFFNLFFTAKEDSFYSSLFFLSFFSFAFLFSFFLFSFLFLFLLWLLLLFSFLLGGHGRPNDFLGKNSSFCDLKKKVPSNMVNGTFRKNSKNVITFSGFFFLKLPRFL